MAPPSISIHPVLPSDFLPIAKLEVDAFAKEEFDVVAFGPNRFSDAATEGRAKSLAAGPKPGETLRNMKAVVTLPDGTEEIVGFASSNIVVGRAGSEGEKKRLGTKEEWAESAEKGEVKDPFGPDADMKFCHDAIIKGDEHMAASTMGTNYASKFLIDLSESMTNTTTRIVRPCCIAKVPATRYRRYATQRLLE